MKKHHILKAIGYTVLILNIPQALANYQFIDVGMLNAGNSSSIYDITVVNGVPVAVGSTNDGAAGNQRQAVNWTLAGGMVSLGNTLGGGDSFADSVSADGQVVVGTAAFQAFRWDSIGGMVQIAGLPTSVSSSAWGTNADGTVTVGSSDMGGGIYEAFKYQNGATTSLDPGHNWSQSSTSAVNANGTVVVGNATDINGRQWATRWTQNNGIVPLSGLPGETSASTNGVNAEGSVVVGTSSNAGSEVAFRWTQTGGMVSLGFLLGGVYSYAYGVNANGSVVVGEVYDSNVNQFGFIWTRSKGMQLIQDILTQEGVLPAGWTLTTVISISADGRWLGGYGTFGGQTRGWVVRRVVVGDLTIPDNGSGTGGALTALQGALQASSPSADIIDFGEKLLALKGNAQQAALDGLSPQKLNTEVWTTESRVTLAKNTLNIRMDALRNFRGDSSVAAPFTLALAPRRVSALSFTAQSAKPQGGYAPDNFLMNLTAQGLTQEAKMNMAANVNASKGQGSLWVQPFASVIKQNKDATSSGYKASIGGFLACVDYKYSDNVFIGGGVGYSFALTSWMDEGGSSRLRTPLATFYGTWSQGNFHIDGSMVASLNFYSTGRNVPLINKTAYSRHRGYTLAPHLGFGYALTDEGFTVEPFLNMDFTLVRENGYTENGAGSFCYQIQPKSSRALRSETGLKFSANYAVSEGILTPELSISYINKRIIGKDKVSANFVNNTFTFSSQNMQRNRHQVSPAASLTFSSDSGFYTTLGYKGELSRDFRSHEASLKIGKRF